jgi:hypothetical protein
MLYPDLWCLTCMIWIARVQFLVYGMIHDAQSFMPGWLLSIPFVGRLLAALNLPSEALARQRAWNDLLCIGIFLVLMTWQALNMSTALYQINELVKKMQAQVSAVWDAGNSICTRPAHDCLHTLRMYVRVRLCSVPQWSLTDFPQITWTGLPQPCHSSAAASSERSSSHASSVPALRTRASAPVASPTELLQRFSVLTSCYSTLVEDVSHSARVHAPQLFFLLAIDIKTIAAGIMALLTFANVKTYVVPLLGGASATRG